MSAKLAYEKLAEAVREHIKDVDAIMNMTTGYSRGQQIAHSVGRLEKVLRFCESTSPGSAATTDSSSPGPTAKPSSPAASTPAPKKPKKR